ncbi:minor tail protein [Gordonia phage Lilbeanie]|uniref:Minor tail protein n=1 Tax=Gordonia phage Lilbeanie TaxID=2794947 RepID=A0A7T1NXJ9_9CAUD|nr:minor tail protein [Gordonia phage Lilbeanie]QPO17110.1 minor tail protein [Gordonia phage Lilbeanie]
MTSPDYLAPEKAYSATTITGLQDVDPNNPGGANNSDMMDQLEQVRSNLFLTLLGGFTSVPSAVTTAVNAIISAITGLLDGGLPDLSQFFDNLGGQLEAIEESIADLEAIAPSTPSTPAYVADINDMATCSRDDLYEYYQSGTSESPSVSMRAAKYTPAKVTFNSVAPVDYTPIVVDRRGLPKKLRWRVGNDTSLFGIDAYYMALCILNPANGNIEKAWDSGNIKDGVANTTTLTEVGVALTGITQLVTPGQILFIAHQQIAPGLAQGARSFACKPQPGGAARPGQLLDAWHYRTPGNHGSIPSSVSFASLERRNNCIPWGAIEVDTTVTEAP